MSMYCVVMAAWMPKLASVIKSLKGEKHDIWSVNASCEYHEEIRSTLNKVMFLKFMESVIAYVYLFKSERATDISFPINGIFMRITAFGLASFQSTYS